MKPYCYKFIVSLLLIISPYNLCGEEVYLCVWRNPERTMKKLFPNARDYKTNVVKINTSQRDTIESKLGFPLLPGQEKSFQYFTMFGKNKERIGTIIAASQKGQYGAIEFVVGINNNNEINGIYIQRARERDRSFKKRAFLDLFIGQKMTSPETIGDAYKGKRTPGTNAVINGLKKEFMAYSILVDH